MHIYVLNLLVHDINFGVLIIAATVRFVNTSFHITEPGIVEVGVLYTGSMTSAMSITVTIEVVSATATGTCMVMHVTLIIITCVTTTIIAEIDYTGVPFNLTLTNGTTNYVNISVIDDDIAERLEVIRLNLSPLASQSYVYLDTSVVDIRIMDNDCKLLSNLCC